MSGREFEEALQPGVDIGYRLAVAARCRLPAQKIQLINYVIDDLIKGCAQDNILSKIIEAHLNKF